MRSTPPSHSRACERSRTQEDPGDIAQDHSRNAAVLCYHPFITSRRSRLSMRTSILVLAALLLFAVAF
jgi:hypothetical protein